MESEVVRVSKTYLFVIHIILLDSLLSVDWIRNNSVDRLSVLHLLIQNIEAYSRIHPLHAACLQSNTAG